jgi:hypothetical protein
MDLLAAVLWGGTDFLVGSNARAVGVIRAVYVGQALGFSIMSVLLIAFPVFILKSLSASLDVLGVVLVLVGAFVLYLKT